jgi:hypothetical protein
MTIATDIALDQVAALLRAARSAMAFTGAGISVESGIPHFRGEGGLWTKFDPYKVAHIDTFRKDPAQYWSSAAICARSSRRTPTACIRRPAVARSSSCTVRPTASFAWTADRSFHVPTSTG